MIRAENLGKVYRTGRLEVPALRNATFSVEAGEFVAIVGPSGSGKSTLFYLLGGLTRASSGRVLIGGTDFSALGDAERTRMRRSRIGFIFQKFNLLPTLTARSNIEIAYEISGRTESMDQSLFTRLTDLLNISSRLDHRPSELSGGEQQRVAIARALCMNPQVMLFDEPTSSLDPVMVQEVLDVIAELANAGMTTICVTHEMSFARRLADRIIFLDSGRIDEMGPPARLFNEPRSARLKAFLQQERPAWSHSESL
jgi:putative ABC transport system ATP-binding protein